MFSVMAEATCPSSLMGVNGSWLSFFSGGSPFSPRNVQRGLQACDRHGLSWAARRAKGSPGLGHFFFFALFFPASDAPGIGLFFVSSAKALFASFSR